MGRPTVGIMLLATISCAPALDGDFAGELHPDCSTTDEVGCRVGVPSRPAAALGAEVATAEPFARYGLQIIDTSELMSEARDAITPDQETQLEVLQRLATAMHCARRDHIEADVTLLVIADALLIGVPLEPSDTPFQRCLRALDDLPFPTPPNEVPGQLWRVKGSLSPE